MVKSVAILGATGSVGGSALALIAANPDAYRASILTGGSNAKRLADLALQFRPDHVGLADETQIDILRDRLSGTGIVIHGGVSAIADLAAMGADLILSAITGAAGLLPTLTAVRCGGVVAIANKESLVMAGSLLMAEAAKAGTVILPLDSEHNAISQAWSSGRITDIRGITLTASGGPFWDWDLSAMAAASPAEAINHPNWSMGAKISVDSATMMNKGLEVIEASVLFGLAEDLIDVLVHPASVVHGLVHYRDGSVLAQMAAADMRVPISYALAWPGRMDWPAPRLDLAALGGLSFFPPDDGRFPCLGLARGAARQGGLATAVLNAANEVAVLAFLDGRIGFLDIASLCERALTHLDASGSGSLDDILAKDIETRHYCDGFLSRRNKGV